MRNVALKVQHYHQLNWLLPINGNKNQITEHVYFFIANTFACVED